MEKNVGLIEEKLEERGYELGRISPSGEAVNKISKQGKNVSYDSDALYSTFLEENFSLVVYHTILHLSSTKGDFVMLEDLRQYLQDRIQDQDVQEICQKCPVTTIRCPSCNGLEFEQIQKSNGKRIRCTNGCGDFKQDNLEEQEYWESIGTSEIFEVVQELSESGFLGLVYLKQCHYCGEEFEAIEREEDVEVKCDNCGRNSDLLTSIFATDLNIANKEGSWFEWFCYKSIIESIEPDAYCLPRYVRKDDYPTETDGIFVIDGELCVIDAKAKNIKKNLSRGELPDQMIDWQNFADSIGVISTSKISSNGKNMYEDNITEAEVRFIEEDQIWKIPELLA